MTTVGFFGLPGSGKSTVFHALTRQALTPQFLGYDLKPHQAVVEIPDARLDRLEQLFAARSKVCASMEFVDIPGFDPGSTETKMRLTCSARRSQRSSSCPTPSPNLCRSSPTSTSKITPTD